MTDLEMRPGRSPRGRWRGPTRGSPRSGPGSTGPASSPPRPAALRDRDPGHRPYELHRCTGRERHAASRRSGRRVRPDRGLIGTAAHGLVSCHVSVCPRRSWGGRRGVPAGARAVRVDLRRRRADAPDRPRHPAAAVDRGRVLRPPAAPDGPPVRGARHAVVNPQTGPFYVEGAEPGDTLALHFADLTPARDWGASTTIPFFGGADRHGPHRAAAGAAARADLDLPARPRPGHRAVRGARAATCGWSCRSRRCSAPSGVAPAGRRGAHLPGARQVRRQHGHPRDARRDHGLPGGQRRGRAVLRRRRALPAGRGRVLRHGGRGRDGRDR